jgi:hypothetical protein
MLALRLQGKLQRNSMNGLDLRMNKRVAYAIYKASRQFRNIFHFPLTL